MSIGLVKELTNEEWSFENEAIYICRHFFAILPRGWKVLRLTIIIVMI